MKKIKIFYWVVTGLFAAFMLFTAIPDVIKSKDAVEFITKLGYPAYLVPFIGVAKVLASIVVVLPGFTRLKEWAYAGLVIDLVGAGYSFISLGFPFTSRVFMAVFIGFAFLSYALSLKMQKLAIAKS